MTRHGPEEECQRGNASADKDCHPDCPSKEQLLDVRLTDSERPEGSRLGLAEEYEDRIQLVLVGDQEENGDAERNEELGTVSV